MAVLNKTVVVTGGDNGIEREIVLLLLKKGARAAVVGIDEAGLKVTTNLAGNLQGKLSSHIVDITTPRGVPHQSMADEFLCHKNDSEW